jgi:hypothetical protein
MKKFADRLLTRGKEHDAAKSKERQARGKARDRGMERRASTDLCRFHKDELTYITNGYIGI